MHVLKHPLPARHGPGEQPRHRLGAERGRGLELVPPSHGIWMHLLLKQPVHIPTSLHLSVPAPPGLYVSTVKPMI